VVLDPLRAREVVEHALAVLAEAELDQRVAARPRRRALTEEAEPPQVEPRIGSGTDADGRLVAAQRADEHGGGGRGGARGGGGRGGGAGGPPRPPPAAAPPSPL